MYLPFFVEQGFRKSLKALYRLIAIHRCFLTAPIIPALRVLRRCQKYTLPAETMCRSEK